MWCPTVDPLDFAVHSRGGARAPRARMRWRRGLVSTTVWWGVLLLAASAPHAASSADAALQNGTVVLPATNDVASVGAAAAWAAAASPVGPPAVEVAEGPGASADGSARFHYDPDDNTLALGHGFVCALAAVTTRRGAPGTAAASGGSLGVGGVWQGARISCWGRRDAATAAVLAPPSAGDFVQVAAAEQHACGLRAHGGVACWGGVFRGRPLPLGGDHAFVQVTAGGTVVCGLLLNGTAVCVGQSNVGQTMPPTGAVFVQISCGKSTCCGLAVNASLACWGDSYAGVATPPAGAFVQVSLASHGTACALDSDGALVCWGSFVGPQGGTYRQAGPYAQVAAGSSLTCAIRLDGGLDCLGEASRVWAAATAPSRRTRFREISAHGWDICGVTAEVGTPRFLCWGEHGGALAPPAGVMPAG